MTPLIAFITARLDEDEECANMAVDARGTYWVKYWQDRSPLSPNWSLDYNILKHRAYVLVGRIGDGRRSVEDGIPGVVTLFEDDLETAYDKHRGELAQTSEHIARHDPARVLRFVKAVRTIIAVRNGLESAGVSHMCDDCHGYNVEIRTYDDALRTLAGTWSDHPDYEQATQ